LIPKEITHIVDNGTEEERLELLKDPQVSTVKDNYGETLDFVKDNN